jgi:hypothetical protein
MRVGFAQTLEPLKISGFRRLVGAAFVSGLGDSLIPIAFALESHRIEPSGWGLTIVLLSLWSGRLVGMVAVQRSGPATNPVRVMIGSDLVRFTAQGGLLVWLIARGSADDPASLTIAALALSSSVYGVATAFFQPARFTAIPRIVPVAHHGQANAWLSVLGDVFAVAGPLAGSVVVLLLGFQAVLIIDAGTFLLGVGLLLGVRVSSQTSPDAQPDDEGTGAGEHVRGTLPTWVNAGLITWLFVALAIGFLGTAGPTLVINQNSPRTWAIAAACMAVGSLLGSTGSLLGLAARVRWRYLHLLCCVGIALQLLCFLLATTPAIIWTAGLVGAALTTLSGIRWDTLGQSAGDDHQIHEFAARDQLVNTVGIPMGMLIFGIASGMGANTGVVIVVACVVASMGLVTVIFPQPESSMPSHEPPVSSGIL